MAAIGGRLKSDANDANRIGVDAGLAQHIVQEKVG